MSRKSRSVSMLFLAVMMVILSGCSATTTSSKQEATPTPIPPPPIPEKPTYTVKRGEVIDSLSFTGRVSPAIEEELFFRENGRVKTVFVEREDMVTVGTVLAELENDDLVRQLAQAQIELETAEIGVAEAQAANQYDIESARIDLESRQLELTKLQDSLESLELELAIAKAEHDLALKEPTAEELAIERHKVENAQNSLWAQQLSRDAVCGQGKGTACDSAQAAVQRAEASTRIAEIQYQQFLQGLSAEEKIIIEARYQQSLDRSEQIQLDIALKEKQVQRAQLNLTQLESSVDPQLTKALERAKLSVERLQAQVENTRIESPIDGKITSVSAYEGREVAAYKSVFVVADEAELEITAEPMSSQLQELQEGMNAAIILSAYPGKELPAEIFQLPYPYGKGGGATVEEADKLTHINFDPLDLTIGPGDLVKVLVVIEEKADALWLPPAAIRTFAGRKFVVVDDDGRQQRVDITVGIESSERVEIEDGLEEGQTVVGQ